MRSGDLRVSGQRWSWQRHLLYVPSWLDLFAIGAALAVVSAWSTETGGVSRRSNGWADIPCSRGSACAVFCSPRGCTCRMIRSPSTARNTSRYLLYGITALLLLAPGMFGDQQVGRLRAVLRSRPLVILGTVSLGFYLFHKAVLSQVADWTDAAPFQAHLWKLLLIAYPLSVAIAAVSYYAVERPALHLKRTASAASAARTPAP
jgi:peptidoglycan/LPS O-acetylase OafA/YrhL